MHVLVKHVINTIVKVMSEIMLMKTVCAPAKFRFQRTNRSEKLWYGKMMVDDLVFKGASDSEDLFLAYAVMDATRQIQLSHILREYASTFTFTDARTALRVVNFGRKTKLTPIILRDNLLAIGGIQKFYLEGR